MSNASCDKDNIKCIENGCGKAQFCRGLCTTHYNRITAAIKRGEVTLQELEEQGRISPRKRRIYKRF